MGSPSYIELLRDPRWQRKRLQILERDDWKCRDCGEWRNNLQVHHKKYERGLLPWEMADRFLVTLCHRCHERATALQQEIKEIVAEIPMDQLFFAVDALKRSLQYGTNPLQAALSYCDGLRSKAISSPFTREASRQLDALDEASEGIWAVLDASTSRTYGDAI